MALEDLTGASKFIDDLDSANPVGTTDFLSGADDHLRGIKNVLKNTFPNLTGAANPTQAELNHVVGVTSGIQAQMDLKVAAANGVHTGVTEVAEAKLVAYHELAEQYTATTGTRDLDVSGATYFYPSANLGAAVITFTFSNPVATGRVSSFTMELLGADGATLTWPASVDWPSGIEPTWSTGTDIVSFVTRDGGTTWFGFLGGQAFS